MAFGFGKKKNPQQTQQISPEALALLEQMAANAPQGQQSAMPMMPPVQAGAAPVQPQAPMAATAPHPDGYPASPTAPQMAPPTPHDVASQPHAFGSSAPSQNIAAPSPGASPEMIGSFRAPTMASMPDIEAPAPGKKARKQKKQKLSREEKKLAAAAAKEEKIRAKRRKKMAKSRFSRARYLREANGNAVAGLALWIFLIIVFIAGPFVLNTQILLPQTRENNDVINQISQLRDTITRSQPQLEIAIRDKSQRENQIKSATGSFVPKSIAVTSLEAFVSELRANGIEFDENVPTGIIAENLGVTGLLGQTINLKMRADFLTYLRIRNKFVIAQPSIRVSEERITAQPNDPVMNISLRLTIPSKDS